MDEIVQINQNCTPVPATRATNATTTGNVDAQHCVTELLVTEAAMEQTGLYICHYKDSQVTSESEHHQSNRLYVFVNDADRLLVTVDGTEFVFLSLVQSQPATIPCIPSISDTQMYLVKTQATSGPETIAVDDISVSYDPTKGFHFKHPQWDADSSFLECIASYGGKNQSKHVSIHWTIDPIQLHPYIDDSGARLASVNRSFTLNCQVNIELGVLIHIEWHYPSSAEDNRIEKGFALAQSTSISESGYQFQQYSRNITIHDAKITDSGIYTCKVRL